MPEETTAIRQRNSDTAPDHGPAGRKRLTRALIVSAAVLISGALACVIFLVLRGPANVEVPDLTGETLARAEAIAEKAGLKLDPDVEEPLTDEVEIRSQDPAAGKEVKSGSSVFVVLEEIPEIESESDVKDSETGETGEGREASPPATDESTEAAPAPGPGASVCLDPGHSGPGPTSEIDPDTGIDVADNYGASGELQAVFDLALRALSLLEERGVTVVMTKSQAGEYVNIKRRAEIGNTTSLMVRLHFDQNLHAIIHPTAGQYKQGTGGPRIYVDPGVAAASEEAARFMQPYLQDVGISRIVCDCGGTSHNTGPAFVGSVYSSVPVVLIENNPSYLLNNPSGQEQVAQALASAIQAYLSR